LLQKLPVVLYNRVPKTGSTTFTNLVYSLAKSNEIYVLHINTSGNNIKMAVSDQASDPNALRYFYIHIKLFSAQ